MKVRMTARHFELTDNIKQHVESRSEHFGRFCDNIIDLHWILEVNNHRHMAETTAKVFGAVLAGKAEGADLRSAIDEAAHKMESQLKKYKGRLKDKNPKAVAAAKAAAAESESGTASGDNDEGDF